MLSEDTSGTSIYLADIDRYIQRLNKAQIRMYSRRIQRNPNDTRAVNIIVYSFLPLVLKIARKNIGQGVEYHDLIQEGNIGLIRAVKKWRHGSFIAYAKKAIQQHMTRAIDNQGDIIRVPVYQHDKIRKLAPTRPVKRRGKKESKSLRFLRDLRREVRIFSEIEEPESQIDDLLDSKVSLNVTHPLDPTLPILAKETLTNLLKQIRSFVCDLRKIGIGPIPLRDFEHRYGLNGTFRIITMQEVAEARNTDRQAVSANLLLLWKKVHRAKLDWDDMRMRTILDRILILMDFLQLNRIPIKIAA